jgi:26 proteasome complex subunit DSS1
MSSNQGSSSKSTQPTDNNSSDKDKQQQQQQQQKQEDQPQKESIPQLGALEEDDEFEEFTAEDWNETEEDQETHLWEDNWDDEDVEDDFSKQLRAEITKNSGNSPTPMKIQ